MHRLYIILTLFAFFPVFLYSQKKDSLDQKWTFSIAGYYYFVLEDENSLSFTGYADHKKLHLEARYNYEDQNTASVFGGWRFEAGNRLQLEAIPMIGIVFGNTNGFAPGLELNIAYGKFDYYSETEYIIDFAGKENNFLYTWGELAFSPIKRLRGGFSYQRTHLYQTGLDVQPGMFAKYSFRKLSIGAYYFNPFSNEDLVIATIGIDF